jgi:carbon storage regulator
MTERQDALCASSVLVRRRKEPSIVVLSLHCHETIMVGNDIEITVVHIDGNTVHLEVNAPSEVDVHRKEIREATPHETTGETEPIWLCMN